jgi:hypothetical protein
MLRLYKRSDRIEVIGEVATIFPVLDIPIPRTVQSRRDVAMQRLYKKVQKGCYNLPVPSPLLCIVRSRGK